MGLNHNCLIGDNLKYIESGFFGKQRKAKCIVCGNLWSEDVPQDQGENNGK